MWLDVERKAHVERLAKAIERRYEGSVNQAPYCRGSDLAAVLENIDPAKQVEACMASELMLFTKVETRFLDSGAFQ